MKKFIVCITGASGFIYGKRLVEELSKKNRVYLVVSKNGYVVMEREMGIKKEDFISELPENVKLFEDSDISASIASGSRVVETEGVIIAPCSLGTLGAIANGISSNLVHRVAHVALKERKKLFILLREMPLSYIHIDNMKKISLAGGIVSVASPGFYHRPKTVEDMVNFVVGKILDNFGIKHSLYRKWREDED
ncbi:MAG: UbiX family flavin prenyltransferase [Aquificota bacterium]|nr:MAG: UbiX family flavin prenyltransferase [Aquificota bacterium]